MKILITGDEGFVGRAYHRYFDGQHDITGIDIKSGNDCRDFFKQCDERFDLVIHLAAIVGGRLTIEYDPLSVATDLAIDSDMFNWALRTKQPQIIYFSSSAAYPASTQNEFGHYSTELEMDIGISGTMPDSIGVPDMTYGWTKLTGEILAHHVRKQSVWKTNVLVFRPFSGYGEDQDLTYPFPSFIKRVVDRHDPFEIWGDGLQTRDFIHVDDIVAATMALHSKWKNGTFNLGWGRPTNFRQLAEIMFEISGWRPSRGITYDRHKPTGPKFRVGTVGYMLESYRPTITLEQGITRALEFHS